MSTFFWQRSINLQIGNKTFSGDDFEISFSVPFDDDAEPNESDIEIYNLSNNTTAAIKNGTKVVLNAGYVGNVGSILIGAVSHRSSDRTGPDHLFKYKVLDTTDKWSGRAVKKTYKKNIKAHQILTDLASLIGLPLVMKLPKNPAYPKGFTADGKFMEVFQQVAKDCQAIAYINKSKLYVRSSKVGDEVRFVLNSGTGLIGSPEVYEDDGKIGYKITSLLNPKITVASIVQVQSKTFKGTLRIKKGKHTCNGNTYYTEMEGLVV